MPRRRNQSLSGSIVHTTSDATVRLTGKRSYVFTHEGWVTVDETESPRDRLLELVDNGILNAEDLAIMVAQFLTNDEVEKMLDLNERTARFDNDSEA